MDELRTPYLFNSGLKLDFVSINSSINFSDQGRLPEEKCFTNGMMAELRKFIKLDNNLFFEFVKSIVPLSILNENFPKNRQPSCQQN